MIPTLLHVFPSFAVGGSQVRMSAIANHFGPRWGHLILALNGCADCAERLGPNVRYSLIDPESGPRRQLWRLRPSRLITYNWGAMDWAMANWPGFIPHLHVEDGFGPEESSGQLARRVWARRLLLRNSALLLPSRTLYQLARDVWRLPARHLHLVPNGIDCARFSAPQDRAFAVTHGLGGGAPIIGTVTALRPEKNLRRLIDAFALVAARQPCRLAIVGEGVEFGALRAHAVSLGLARKVIFTGACPQPERLLPFFTAFALSSDTEQMPISVLEAMAAGLPVAATDVGDIHHMVAEENLPYLTPLSPVSLADSLTGLLRHPDKAKAAGAANAARARALFEQSAMFAAWAKLLG